MYSLTYVRILYTVHYGNMQHAHTVAYTRHICTRRALHAGVYMLTAQATIVLPRWGQHKCAHAVLEISVSLTTVAAD